MRAPVEHPLPGRCEMLVPAFEECISTGVLKLACDVGNLNDVRLVCFASQGNTFTLLDSGDRSLCPFVLWTDQRARELEPSWADFTKERAFYATTGIAQFDHHFISVYTGGLKEIW